MAITITVIHGLSFNLLIEEVNDRDPSGRLVCYLASIYKQDKGTSARRLVRRSRLPGAAAEMTREIQRDGIRAFRRLAHI